MEKKQNSIGCIVSFILVFFVFAMGVSYAYNTSEAPSGYSPQKGLETPFQVLAEEGNPDILLIQTANPWNSNADPTVLDALGYSYRIIDITEVPTANINDYQVVLIVNDQVQSFYDNYADNYDKFEDYVEDGGTLVFFACDMGWASGNNYTDLPGGVEVGDRYVYRNIISNNIHPIVTQELTNHAEAPLTDGDLYCDYTSHNFFVESTLPAGADIIFRTDDADQYPTLAVYNLGAGTVIASGLTWEFNYDRYIGPDQKYGFGRALPDVFKYAFSIAGGHKTSGVNVDIYPEDYWLAQRQEVYKAKKDLLDIVACISNNTNPNVEQTDVSLTLTIDNANIDTNFLKVYKRASAEEIAITEPIELTQGTQPGQYSITDNNGVREIAINGLTIPKHSEQKWNDFVFRFKIAEDVDNGQTIDAEAMVFGDNIKSVSEKLSDGAATVTVISNGKIVLTNRELMYKQFAQQGGVIDNNGASEVNQLWESLYNISSEQRAVVYHIDKYDRDDDSDNDLITINWFDDRLHLANGDQDGNYHYGDTPTSNDDPNNDENVTNEEEVRINQVATKIKALLNDFITRSGGVGNGRYVAILGGDAIVPFYRVFDPSTYDFNDNDTIESDEHTVLHFNANHDATSVTEVDADNNYLFSDIFYRDFDNKDWVKGEVENIFIGRLAGTSAQNIKRLLVSSNETSSTSSHVVKLENNMRNGELLEFENKSKDAGYTVVRDIDGESIDVPNQIPTFVNGVWVWVPLPFPTCVEGIPDPAKWEVDFKNLFSGDANNVPDFDIMRLMCHGSVNTVSSSEDSNIPSEHHTYFTGSNLWNLWNNDKHDAREHFSSFKPFFIYDACLVGIVDGNSQSNLFNSLLPLNVRGVLGSSGVTWSPTISDFNDKFSNELLKGKSAGESLCIADKKYGGLFEDSNHFEPYTRFQMNLFGLPWAAITPPDDRVAANAIQVHNAKNRNSTIKSLVLGTNTKTITADASNYNQESNDGYDVITIDGFGLLLGDPSTPIVPVGSFVVNIPLNATVDSVTVDFSNSVDLGFLNIPAFQPPPPMPDPDSLLPPGGYVDSPTDLGVFPNPQYSYKTTEIIGYKQVLVDIFPVTVNTGSGQTTLYSSANINVTYTTPDQGLVQSFTSDKRTYAVGGSIETTSIIENISATASSFTVTVDVLDLSDKVISSNSVTQSITSNSVDAITVNLTAPAAGGPFRLSMTASDGVNVIGSSQQEINVVEGRIASFTAPASIDSGSYGSFTVEFENLSQAEITAYEDIYIYDSSGGQVAHLPQIAETIGTGITATSSTQWFPPDFLPSGTYFSYLSVKVNNNIFTMKSNNFIIIGSNDISLAPGWNLISLNLTPEDTAVDSVLSVISGKYLAVWAYTNGSWQLYDMYSPGFSDLATMETGYGYWIYMNSIGVLPVDGTSPAKDKLLLGGWNLVGFNSSSSMSIGDALETIAGKYTSVWAYVDGSWRVYDPANPGISDLTTMEPGYGYWINANESATWTLP